LPAVERFVFPERLRWTVRGPLRASIFIQTRKAIDFMKRTFTVVALLAFALFTLACATTAPAPEVKGTIASINGNTISVTPANGGNPVQVSLGWGTRVYWNSGVEAAGTSVLTAGQPVEVWTNGQTATKVIIAQ
jgi:hypothetical protein